MGCRSAFWFKAVSAGVSGAKVQTNIFASSQSSYILSLVDAGALQC